MEIPRRLPRASQHAGSGAPPEPPDWLAGGGELGALVRAADWSSTPLGPRLHWPQSLRTAVGLVLENKVPMALLWGPELYALYNDGFAAVIADRHPRALGRPAREMWPELWHLSELRLSAVMRGGEAVFREDLRVMLERHGRWAEAFFTVAESPVRVEDGSIGGVMLALQETTAVRERARLLGESEARFRAVVEHSRDGINLLDLGTGRYIFMSPAQVALTGFTAEEINQLSVEEGLARVHPDDLMVSLDLLRRLADGEEPSGEPIEYRWKVKSGEYRWFSDSRGVVRDAEGRPVSLVGISRDVTERKRTEAELRASQEMYAAIFEHSPFALVLSTVADGVIAAVNDAFLQLFELSRDEVVGRRSIDLGVIDPDTRRRALDELAARGRVRDLEYDCRTSSGALRQLSIDIGRVDIGGAPHMLTTIQDISARKEAEAAMQLAQRTQALDELKTRFFASISHELRTPLALILGPTERLLRTPDTTPAVQRDLVTVHRNARTLLDLVNNLLDLAKLEAGRLTTAHAEVDLAELARLAASHFELLREEQQIAFAVEAPPRLPAQLDPEQVQRVLLNLLSNAFKFTPPGGRIRLTLREAAGRARLEVADSGPGIPAARRASVFERFGPVAAGEHRRHAGTGLGLAIARELVQLHGGAISLSDAPEGGALFVVELPLAAPPGTSVRPADESTLGLAAVRPPLTLPSRRAEAAPAADDAAAAAATAAAGAGPLVLVVEDNEAMNHFIAGSLSDRYRVAVALDGREGLARAAELQPDLILCDLMMPEMGGEELLREVRRRPELEATPIVILSAKADDEVRVRLLREGAQDYLTKPFSVEELRTRADNLIARRLAEQATRRAEAKYRGIIATAVDAIISVDEQHRVIEWNRGAEQMFGYARDEALGLTLERLLPEDPPQTIGLRRTGEEFPISATISTLDLDGERISTIAVRDVTQERRIEHEQRVLAEIGGALTSLEYDAPLRELARIVAGSIGDFALIYVADERGVLHRTAAASRIPAYAWITDLVLALPPIPAPPEPLRQVLAERRPFIYEFEPEHYDAVAESPEHLRTLLAMQPRCTMFVPLDGTRRCVGILAITSLCRQFDADDLHLSQEVARRCALFIENAGLHRAERRATQARDEVLGVVAHDLRSPLNNVLLYADLLRSAVDSDRSAKHVEVIERNAARMNRIIADLLDIAQMEMGQLKIERASISAADLIAEVAEQQGAQAAARSIALRLEAREGLPAVSADRDRLIQVFDNLIGNALKFTQEGSITLGARPSGREVVFWVADTGPGIAPEDVPHVFDRFWQARSGGQRGTAGLGLAIVKGIVEAHGGRVWVESELGAGTTFFFMIPVSGAGPAGAGEL